MERTRKSFFGSDEFKLRLESVDPEKRTEFINRIKLNMVYLYKKGKMERIAAFERDREAFVEKRASQLERRSIKKRKWYNQKSMQLPEKLSVIKRINYKKVGRQFNLSEKHYSPWKGSTLEWMMERFVNGGDTQWWNQPYQVRRRASIRPNQAKDNARVMWQREYMNWTARNYILYYLTQPRFNFDLRSLLDSVFNLFPTTSRSLDRVILKRGHTLWALKRDSGRELKGRSNPTDYLSFQVDYLKDTGQHNFIRDTMSKVSQFISMKTNAR